MFVKFFWKNIMAKVRNYKKLQIDIYDVLERPELSQISYTLLYHITT